MNEVISRCIETLPELSRALVDYFRQAEPDFAVNNFVSLRYGNENHAAWKIIDWPNFDLPHDVESYGVYLLDNAQLVSNTKLWKRDHPVTEQYDPRQYATETLNAQSVYTAMLPLGDYGLEEKYRKRLTE